MDGAQGGGVPDPPLPAVKPPDKSRRDEWSEGGVLSLLEVYEAKWVLRNRAKLKGSDWEDIARQVSIRFSGTKNLKTPSQCKNKIESMKKRYRAESAITQHPASCSSWQFYACMDNLLKGTTNASAHLKSDNNINLQSQPKVEVEVEMDGRLQDSNPDDGSNTLPIDVNVNVNANANANVNNDNNKEKKESRDADSDVSAPRSKVANVGNGVRTTDNPCKRRKGSGSEVAESIRLLAHSILKIEQARMEMYKESERMRAEAEIKRGEMELKKTEIIAKTQLQIAKLFLKRSHARIKRNDSSPSRDELDMLPQRERMDD